jgi:hypothetical protein
MIRIVFRDPFKNDREMLTYGIFVLALPFLVEILGRLSGHGR